MNELVVVGAGPAGLAAAAAACDRGRRVMLLDASDAVGGQFWRHLPVTRPAHNESILHHGWATFTSLSDRLERDELCEIVTSAHVWAIEGMTLHLLIGPSDGVHRKSRTLVAETIVFATGAYDRVLPIPGWDLPGVFTAGGAQALAKGERLAVGRRVVVAGAGPFLLPVTVSLSRTGSSVIEVLEASRSWHLAREWLTRPWEMLGAYDKVGELRSYVSHLAKHRIKYATGCGVTAIHGSEKIEAVTISKLDATWAPIAGTERTVEVDALCLGHGFTPRLELPIAAGARLTRDRFVDVDDEQRTSVPGVFAVGEITGIGGVDLALAEGAIGGHVASGGKLSDGGLRRHRARRTTFGRFATRISRAHALGDNWSEWLEEDTIVCRCEEVTFERLIEVARATRSQGFRSLKLSTRAGLGACQGRVCGRTVEELLRANSPGGALIDGAISDHRPIAMPIRLSEVAGTVAAANSPLTVLQRKERNEQ
jgi:NADPH-dependent 2,4-dienoyl-CoA reductase/sulfur reductase-like enzyme